MSSSSSDDNTQQVEQACQALKTAVTNFIRKCDQKQKGSRKRKLSESSSSTSLSSSISKIVDHACYWLRQMTIKRQSLQLGIQALLQHVRSVAQLQHQQQHDDTDISKWLSSWLQHVFDQYLRLRDGIVLLTSGECRHEGDVVQSQKSQTRSFQSRLKSTATRPDGYTVLYRGDHYCGFSWDEGMDADVGIQHRLQQALYQYYCHVTNNSKMTPDALWEQYIVEKAPMYGLVLDQHEVYMDRAQKELDTFRQILERDLNRMMAQHVRDDVAASRRHTSATKSTTAAIRVQLVAHDKMERLQVTMVGMTNRKTTSMVIERRANQFQIRDPRGVLPNHMTLTEWSEVMTFSLASTALKKTAVQATQTSTTTAKTREGKRGMLSLQEDRSQGNVTSTKRNKPLLSLTEPMSTTTTTASGLVVRATKTEDTQSNNAAAANSTDDPNSSSIAEIKRQLGVDVEQLEEGRAILEAEEELALQEAQAIDLSHELDEEESDLHYDIEHQKRLVEYLTTTKLPKVSKLTLDKLTPSRRRDVTVEAWDIRESLRQSYMTIGNHWLALYSIQDERRKMNPSVSSSSSSNKSSPDQLIHLNRAFEAFEQALHWVEEQETSLAAMTPDPQQAHMVDDELDPLQLRITTSIYRGRAYTNLGIVLLRQWQESSGYSRRHVAASHRQLEGKEISLLLRSKKELDRALESVESLLITEQITQVDRVMAHQLISLASRWKGTALWHQGEYSKAVVVMLEQGCDALWLTDQSNNRSLLQIWKRRLEDDSDKLTAIQDEVEWGVECYYNCICLADLAGEALETLVTKTNKSTKENSNGGGKAQELLEWSKRALQQAANVSKTIAALVTLHSHTSSAATLALAGYEIKEPQELEKAQEELIDWWKEATKMRSTKLPRPDRLSAHRLPRNDLLGDCPAPPHDPDVLQKRFTVQHNEGDRWRRQRRRQKHPRGGPSSQRLRRGVDDDLLMTTTPAPAQRQYRKWGDQLLPQIEMAPGKFVPKIEYPAVAPEMPPEIKRIVAKMQANQKQ